MIGDYRSEPGLEGVTPVAFEDYALGLLESDEFMRLCPGIGRAFELRLALYKHNRTGLKFCVAAKFLDRTSVLGDSHGLIKIVNESQKKELFEYSRQLMAPCFLIIGVGDAQGSIDRMALIPLEMVKTEVMRLHEIMGNERYQNDPITFIELAECHATCGEVDAVPRFLVNVCEIVP
jgi:hypothetical protein